MRLFDLAEEEAAAAVAAADRVMALAALARAEAMPDTARRAIAEVGAAGDAYGDDPVGFVGALVAAWRAAALYCDAVALAPLVLAETIARLADVAGGKVRPAEIATMVAALGTASIRVDYPAQQDAARARAALAGVASQGIEAAGVFGADAVEWLSGLTGQAATALSRIAANRAPLVRVETGLSLSAIRAAYDLYGDANRAGEMVRRNAVPAAVWMPVSFEALRN